MKKTVFGLMMVAVSALMISKSKSEQGVLSVDSKKPLRCVRLLQTCCVSQHPNREQRDYLNGWWAVDMQEKGY